MIKRRSLSKVLAAVSTLSSKLRVFCDAGGVRQASLLRSSTAPNLFQQSTVWESAHPLERQSFRFDRGVVRPRRQQWHGSQSPLLMTEGSPSKNVLTV